MGKLSKQKRDSSSRDSSCFIKTNYYGLDEKQKVFFVNNLSNFQVDSAKYIDQFNLNDFKRSNSNSLISDSKKTK